VTSFLKLAVSQIGSIWGKVGLNQKITIVMTLLALVAGFVGLSFWAQRPDYGLVFKGLTQDDTAEMVTILAEEQIPYRTAARGTKLLVPVQDVGRARLKLASQGLPGSRPGFDLFDRNNLGITDFVQHVNYVRALEGELALTLTSLEEVESARVHIVKPEPSFFVSEEKQATASVWVRLRPGARLTNKQISGVVRLTAFGVEGLDAERVSIVDQHGNQLASHCGGEFALTNAQLDTRRDVEAYLTNKARKLLDQILGPGRSHVEVTAELNFKRVTEESTRHDPEGRVVIEEKTMSEKEEPAVRSTAGSAGMASNTTRTRPSSGVSTGRRSDTQEEKKYVVSEMVRRTQEEVGNVKQLWVAVTVDHKEKTTKDKDGTVTTEYEARSTDELTKFEELVKQAVGFVDERDQFQISSMEFDRSNVARQTTALADGRRRQLMVTVVKHASVAVAVIAFLLFIRASLKQSADSAQSHLPALASAAAGEMGGMALSETGEGFEQGAMMGAEPASLEAETETGEASVHELLIERAKSDPQALSTILKRWLSEDGNGD